MTLVSRSAIVVLVAFAGGSSAAAQSLPDRALLANLESLCPVQRASTPDQLLRRQSALAPAGSSADQAAWEELACVRSWLAGLDVRSRESWLMPLGASWRDGAVAVTYRLLDENAGAPLAATLLAALSEDRVLARPDAEIGSRLIASIDAGVRSAIVWRICAEVHSRLSRGEMVERCSRHALLDGADSTFHLIHLARLAAKDADTVRASSLLLAAVGAVNDSSSTVAADWQVRWFLSPDEEAVWDTLSNGSRAPWLRQLLALRDVRDGRPAGARVMEHLNRLEVVLQDFRMNILPINRKRAMELPAEPDGPGGTCDQSNWGGTAIRDVSRREFYGASCTFREIGRWQVEIDDRGAVWMRFGEPQKRAFYVEPQEESNITREAWRYEVDGQPLILSFESEAMIGSPEATRLVPTALRPFLCGIDTYRCTLNNQIYDLPGNPERMSSLREQDFEMIDAATQKDNNAPPVARNIRVGAKYLRLWEPVSRRLIAIAPWAVRLEDIEVKDSVARFDLAVNLWDGVQEIAFDTTFRKEYRVPAKRSGDTQLTGVLDLPASPGVTGWSLFARQEPDAGGRSFDIEAAPLSTGALAISDLVLGAEGQGVRWTGTREPVILAPLGVIDRKEGVLHLYFQVSSRAFHEDASIAIRVYRSDRRGDTPAIAVTMPARLSDGINEVRREIGLSELDSGTYRLEVEVRAGGLVIERSTALVLR